MRYLTGVRIQPLTRAAEDGVPLIVLTGIRRVGKTTLGIVGWLREYGWMRYRGKSHQEAIDEVFQRAKRDIIDELSGYPKRTS